MSRRWWIRYLRGRLLSPPGGLLDPDAPDVELEESAVLLVTGTALLVGVVLVAGEPCARRARCELTGSACTWLGASCCTSARRRAPAGRPLAGGAELTGALLSYSADGSDG
jgi:hypothetical protein